MGGVLWEKNMQNEPVHANQSMKTDIMFRRALSALAFAAALALLPAPARAQSNAAPQGRRGAPGLDMAQPFTNGQAKAQTAALVQYDLEIEGNRLWSGNPTTRSSKDAFLLNIVDRLREAHPEANIALSPELNMVYVENLKLQATSLGDELEALRVASGDKFKFNARKASLSTPELFTIEPSDRFVKDQQEHAFSWARDVQVEVFNFSSYFDRVRFSKPMDDDHFLKFRLEQISQAQEIIETTLQSVANLLVVTGENEEDTMNVARKIINAMIEKPDAPRDTDVSLEVTGKGSKLDRLSNGNEVISWPDGASGQVRIIHADPSNPGSPVIGGSFGPLPPDARRPNPGGSANTNSTQTNR
jgi:hypothetical protein